MSEGKPETRRVISSQAEVLAAAVEVARNAKRALAIFSYELDPKVYDQTAFLDAVKQLALVRSFARVRVIIVESTRAAQYNQQFLYLGQRLPSVVEFRRVGEKHRGHEETFIVADADALIYQPSPTAWHAIVDTRAPKIARKYLELFDEMWAQSDHDPYLRRLAI